MSREPSAVSRLVWPLALFSLALAPRLPGLRLFLTTDEPFFADQAANVVTALLRGDFGATYWHFYPGLTMSWLDGLGVAAQWGLESVRGVAAEPFTQFIRRDILELLVALRLPYTLLSALFVVALYLLVRRLSDQRVALLASLLVAFDPFFLAHSRVAHGDGPVTVFLGVAALAFVLHLQRGAAGHVADPRSARNNAVSGWLVLSAICGGLAALTKSPGPVILPFVILLGLGDWAVAGARGQRKTTLLRRLVELAIWGAVAGVVFVCLWPALWIDPIGTLRRMVEETFGKVEAGHLVFFMGQPTLDPGVWFYPYVIAFRLTPVVWLGLLAAAGATVSAALAHRRSASANGTPLKIAASVPPHPAASSPPQHLTPPPPLHIGGEGERSPGLGGEAHRRHFHSLLASANSRATPTPIAAPRLIAVSAVFVVGLLVFGILSPKKQDRYLLALFPFLDLLAGWGLVWLGSCLHRRVAGVWRGTMVGVAIGVIVVAAHAYPVLSAYPYYLAYFNPLLGGLPRAIETTLVGWGEGMEQVAAFLNRQPQAEQDTVAAVPVQTLLPYYRGSGENFYTNDVALRADWVVLYVSQVQRLAPSPEIIRYFRAMQPEHVVNVLGEPYAWVYFGPKLITTALPADASPLDIAFGDRLHLDGYTVMAEGTGVSVTLFWHVRHALETDYTVSVRLVEAGGRRLAQHDSWPANGLLPTRHLRPGDIVRDVHHLALDADARAAALEVVVYDAASGAVLAEPIVIERAIHE